MPQAAAVDPALATRWQPTADDERLVALDVLRGLALFGVLLINLHTLFRVSLFDHILRAHTEAGAWNHLVDVLLAGLLETKAVSLFSLMFGAGTALQAERAAARGIRVTRFLIRRYMVLLAFGLCHLWLIWDGDILTLYAVCGLLLVPFVRLPASMLAALGIAVISLRFAVDLPIPFPTADAMRAQAIAATHVYQTGTFLEIFHFRVDETSRFIVPLLMGFLPQTAGLMLCGMAAWRSGLLREPGRHRRLLRVVFAGGLAIGATATSVHLLSETTGRLPFLREAVLQPLSFIPLAFAYAAGVVLWMSAGRVTPVARLFASLGRMALTNYLAQSIVLGVIFYGYGFGLFGRVGSALGAVMGIGLYAGQLFFSRAWLRHFHFGPFEWLWRSLTYGRRQPMRRVG